jgi:hypothetical protein
MPQLKWAMLCESSIIDYESNNVSIINVIEQVSPDELPSTLPTPLTLVTLWERKSDSDRDSEDFRFRPTLQSPSGMRHEPDWIGVEMKTPRHRLRTRLLGVPLDQPGEYKIRIELDGGEGVQVAGEVGFLVSPPT